MSVSVSLSVHVCPFMSVSLSHVFVSLSMVRVCRRCIVGVCVGVCVCVWRWKPPCVDSKRFRVCQHNARVTWDTSVLAAHTEAFRIYTRTHTNTTRFLCGLGLAFKEISCYSFHCPRLHGNPNHFEIRSTAHKKFQRLSRPSKKTNSKKQEQWNLVVQVRSAMSHEWSRTQPKSGTGRYEKKKDPTSVAIPQKNLLTSTNYTQGILCPLRILIQNQQRPVSITLITV